MKRVFCILAIVLGIISADRVIAAGNGPIPGMRMDTNRYDSFADMVNDKGWVGSGLLISAALAAVMILLTEARGKRKEPNGSPPSIAGR